MHQPSWERITQYSGRKEADFTALAKANSFRAAQKDKRDEIIKLEKVIDKMELELKQLK